MWLWHLLSLHSAVKYFHKKLHLSQIICYLLSSSLLLILKFDKFLLSCHLEKQKSLKPKIFFHTTFTGQNQRETADLITFTEIFFCESVILE